MRSKSNSNKTRLIKTGVLVLLLVAIAVPAVNLIRTSNDQEGTVLFLSDELVYLDGLDEPLEYAAAVQKPNESATQIVALTKKQHQSLEKGDIVTFYFDGDGIAHVRTIEKGEA